MKNGTDGDSANDANGAWTEQPGNGRIPGREMSLTPSFSTAETERKIDYSSSVIPQKAQLNQCVLFLKITPNRP